MPQTVTFFLGSGCSFPSGQPSVSDLTKELLTGELFLFESLDEHRLFLDSLVDCYPRWAKRCDFPPNTERIKLRPFRAPAVGIQKFLAALARFDVWSTAPNYEDLAGLVRRLAAVSLRDTNDPLVGAFMKQPEFGAALKELSFPSGHRVESYSLGKTLAVVDDFIGWVMAASMRLRPILRGYEAIRGVLTRLREVGTQAHFVTTNYDCNIERLLTGLGMKYNDGIHDLTGVDREDRLWRGGPRIGFLSNERSWLVKLHGSVNWYSCQDLEGAGYSVLAAAPLLTKPADAYRAQFRFDGITFTPTGSPEMLRGSISKAHEYSYSLYSQLLFALEQLLQQTDVLVVAGFGWMDEGIVARLKRFASINEGRLLMCEGQGDEPTVVSRGWMDMRGVGEVGEGKTMSLLRQYPSQMESATLADAIEKMLAHRQ